jgi:alkylation response protein AidB-like acyl-CoA dehydrogenase
MTTFGGRASSRDRVAAQAPDVDRERAHARASLDALDMARLLGLSVPVEHGGSGAGLSALAQVGEAVGRRCASTGMTFVMHVVATATIAGGGGARAQELLRVLAGGEALGTLAIGRRADGRMAFATASSAADVYLVLVPGEDGQGADCFAVARDDGMSFTGSRDRLGMAQSRSIAMTLDDVAIAAEDRIGAPGAAGELVLDVVAPWLLTGLGAISVGIAAAQAAALGRAFGDTSTPRAQAIRHRRVDPDSVVRRTRLLVREAAALGDAGDPEALVPIVEAKIAASEAARDIMRWAGAARPSKLHAPHVL